MKSKILFIFVFTVSLLSETVQIQKVEDGKAFFEKDPNLKNGVSGIIYRKINEKYSSIVSYIIVVDSGVGKLVEFTTLAQDNLPHGKWKPEKGDTIRFFENYNNALIVSKNFDSYLKISKKFQKNWVHPDIFAITLNSIGHPSPLIGDFQYFCREHSVGLIYFQLNNEIKVADCFSMREVEKFSFVSPNGSIQKPFYSRVEEIDGNWFGEGKDEIEDYEKYYKSLLERAE
jgi:hypothetical protein